MEGSIGQELFSGLGMGGLNINESMAAAGALSTDASKYVNDPSVEYIWAMKAYKYAEVHFKLISSYKASSLKLTKHDDTIVNLFYACFGGFKIDDIDEEQFKSEPAKEKWRPFCETFKGKVENYNMGTLLRKDPKKDYTEENTVLVTRIQFYAVEIARNRQGRNDVHFKDSTP